LNESALLLVQAFGHFEFLPLSSWADPGRKLNKNNAEPFDVKQVPGTFPREIRVKRIAAASRNLPHVITPSRHHSHRIFILGVATSIASGVISAGPVSKRF
jgi:hypothetical protein